jgi:hypothetical protein
MNTAPAELLHFLTIAALQPSTSPPSDPRLGVDVQICAAMVGRVLSSRTRRRDHTGFLNSNKKPPGLNSIRQDGLQKTVRSCAYLCESVSRLANLIAPVCAFKKAVITYTLFQFS